jgi:tetratricopeptide (TPR) repeat protein
MILRPIFYTLLFLCFGFITPAFAQEEVDTLEFSKAAKNAKADELYFDALKARTKKDFTTAKALLEQFIILRTDVPAAYYELSRLYSEEKKTDKAATFIKKAILLDANNKWYKEEYATILAEGGNNLDAAAIMTELTKLEPRDAAYPVMASEFYERAKKYQEAIEYIDIALIRSSDDAEELLKKKIALYLEMNQLEKAITTAGQLIAKDPKNGTYHKLLSDLYDKNKMPEKALEVYTKAQKTLPDNPVLQLGLAEHFLRLGDTMAYKRYVREAVLSKQIDADDQVNLLRQFLQTLPGGEAAQIKEGTPMMKELVALHPNDAEVLELYGDFLSADDKNDTAVIVYKKALEQKSSDFELWGKLLGSYTAKKDADSLIKYSEKALRLFPNQAQVHFYNGVGHMNKKEYAAAAKAISRAIDMQPENNKPVLAAMYSTLGDVYNSSKQYELSDEAFEKALQIEPNDASVLNNYSYYLSERGKKLDEAEKMSKKALELSPNISTYLDTYGWILYKKGDYDKAKDYLKRAVELGGDKTDPTLYDHLGDVYYKLKDKNKAVEQWKLAKEKGEDTPQLDKKITEGKLYE